MDSDLPWMQTMTGRRVDLTNTPKEQIYLRDIAYALSRIPRFNGHTLGNTIWSVAEHSRLVAQLLPTDASPTVRLAALLHDAHEAYLGDIISPVKAAISAKGDPLGGIRWSLDEAIAGAFALERGDLFNDAIRQADREALALEKAQLMGPEPAPWHEMPEPREGFHLKPVGAAAAEAAFLQDVFAAIGARHGIDLSIYTPAAVGGANG